MINKLFHYFSEICDAGNFRNATSNDCQPCPVGEYQFEDLQDSCEECPTDHTTDGEGKTHKDNCTCKFGIDQVIYFSYDVIFSGIGRTSLLNQILLYFFV